MEYFFVFIYWFEATNGAKKNDLTLILKQQIEKGNESLNLIFKHQIEKAKNIF
jgi:hypothetical protein